MIDGFGLNELRFDWEGRKGGKQTVKNSNILSSPLKTISEHCNHSKYRHLYYSRSRGHLYTCYIQNIHFY